MKRSSGSAAQPADFASDRSTEQAAPLSTIASARLDDLIDSLLRVQRILEDPLTESSVIAHAIFRMADPVERLAATLESIERDAFLARDRERSGSTGLQTPASKCRGRRPLKGT